MFLLSSDSSLLFWQEPLRVAMANYLRSLMQTAISHEVLEQAVNLVTNDNLDLGCAVIEKAATEKVCSSTLFALKMHLSFIN